MAAGLPDLPTRLAELADRATAQIPPGPLVGGCGVFIARDLVLTCADVVAAEDGSPAPGKIVLHAFGVELEGMVRHRAPAPYGARGARSGPGLAVVEVCDPPRHGCWITPAASPAAAPGSRLYISAPAVGYGAGAGPGGRSADFARFERGLLHLIDGGLPSGSSGAAVLDMENAELYGVMQAVPTPDGRPDGLAVPVVRLRSAFPAVWRRSLRGPHPEWTALGAAVRDQFDRTAGLCEPEDWDRLVGAAEQLGLGESGFTELYLGACGPFPPAPEQPLLDVRDLLRAALNTNPDPDRLHPVIGIVEELAQKAHAPNRLPLHALARRLALRVDPSVQPDLLEQARAARVAPGPAGPSSDPSILTIRVDHDQIGESRRTFINAWLKRSADTPTVCVQAADAALPGAADRAPTDLLMDACRPIIRSCLLGLAFGELIIEFAVPRALLADADVERWHLGDPARPLGVNHSVALRCTDRDEDARFAWQNRCGRFDSAVLAEPATLARFGCADERAPAQLNGALQSHRELDGASLSAGWRGAQPSDSMVAALNNGIPAVLWRRAPCPEHSGQQRRDDPAAAASCTGGQFVRRLAERLAGQPLRRVPALARALRAEAAGLARPDPGHPGQDLALLWDDESRQPWAEGRQRRLAEPLRQRGVA